ncbi:hypothetical protein DDE18_00145 [Nocardioides gansuensis]|uniref:Uncharacterized protein n=1 Tax=Nocardioides gansuensis TaxID=2138300 RepID=A0A2T8FEF7_9ACTN|nr:hypothetical protein DDE18_00145 [Nocardioides gansuensis]
MLLLGGLLAIGGAVYAKLRGQQHSNSWQSSYTPTPPPSSAGSSTPSTAPGAAVTGTAPGGTDALEDPLTDPLPPSGGTYGGETVSDDIGGAEPGEALSDAAEHPHRATTPDDPAESVDVTDPGAPRP